MRHWTLAGLTLWLTPVLAVGFGGLGLTMVPAVLAAGLSAFLVAVPASRRIAEALDSHATLPPLLSGALAVAAVMAILQCGSISIFMADVTRQRFSVQPDDEFRRAHSCVSAYAEASRFLSEGTHNIYERDLYRPAGVPRRLGPLTVDPYHYPPSFLLLPQAVRTLASDFWDFRRLWFTLQSLVLAGSIVGLAAWIGGQPGAIALLGGVVLLALPHPAATLQQGNFQMTAVPAALVAFVLLITGRLAAGGGVLAYAALAKIFPGILVVPLVTGRRWRAVAWVSAMALAILAATVASQGPGPVRDFVSTSLPELSSGAAFPQTEIATHSRVNWSAYGETVRLRELGAAWLTQPRGLVAAELYGLLVVALAAWAGWSARFHINAPAGRILVLQFGLGLIGLASFRSPFVGAIYGVLSTLWIMTLFAARASTPAGTALWLAALGALATATWLVPSPAAPPAYAWVWITGLLVLACMAINAWAVVDAVRRPAEGTGGVDAVHALGAGCEVPGAPHVLAGAPRHLRHSTHDDTLAC